MLRLAVLTSVLPLLFTILDSSHAVEQGDSNAVSIEVSPHDWPWWRGPNRNAVANANQSPPILWSDEKESGVGGAEQNGKRENVRWKARVPGRGHGSPTVVGDFVFLASAEKETEVQSVLCYDRHQGKLMWQTAVHQGGFLTKKSNEKASLASSTLACDGRRVFINFLNGGAVYTTALDLSGQRLWQTKISDYVVHQGYGSSPAIYGPLVIVSADNKSGGAIAGLDRADGHVVWRHDRPQLPNYASPIILPVDGRAQLLFTGCDLVSAFEPLTGRKLWEMEGSTTECVTSIVSDGQLVFTSGGYPRNHISAVRADGSGKIAWEDNVRVYVPSMLVHEGYLYAVTDAGVAFCRKSSTGEEVWKQRLGGTFTSSPVLVGQRIFVTNEAGKTFIFRADPNAFEAIGENQLGDEVYATPAICGNRIYARVANQIDLRRQEWLYCIANPD